MRTHYMACEFSRFRTLLLAFFLSVMGCSGENLSALFLSSTSNLPATDGSFDAAGKTITLDLEHAPTPGTTLTVLNNTGRQFIRGRFSNLAHGQAVWLEFGGIRYRFVANYFGGTGNDLVLQWANVRLLEWGGNPNATPQRAMTDVTALPGFAGKTILDIACGASHQIALCADGSLIAWGSNTYGQLGTGGTFGNSPNQVNPFGVLAGKTVVAISAGRYHSVALCSDGTIAAWGDNSNGQLGDGSRVNRTLPVLVDQTGVLGGKEVISVHAGQSHTVAVCADGFVAAWGSNQFSQLGNASYVLSAVPVAVNLTGALTGKTIVSLDTGSNHNLALCSDGTLAAWGSNSRGQLGNGNLVSSNTPVSVIQSGVLAGKTITSVSCGNLHSMVICGDGTLASWGRNVSGQLGSGNTTDRTSPVLVNRNGVLSARTVSSLDAGFSHSLAVCTDGLLASWGDNLYWQLGTNTGTANTSTIPVLASTSALRPGERYIACNAGDISNSSFALVAYLPAPTATTLAAASIGDTSVTLRGQVNAAGATTAVTFKYGTSIYDEIQVDANTATVTGQGTVAADRRISGLIPGRTYRYRVIASNANGVSEGENMSFTTGTASTLSSLAVSVGSLGPVFSAEQFEYFVSVPHDTPSIQLTPTASSPGSSITIKGSPVSSGSPSPVILLEAGNNPTEIQVVSTSGSETSTYVVTVNRLPATWVYQSAIDVPVSSRGFSLESNSMSISLGFPPTPGTALTVLKNTGSGPIHGEFADLTHGQTILLGHERTSYAYIANYHGGTGNDLVLEWAANRVMAWGENAVGQLGDNSITARLVPTPVLSSGVLSGKTILKIATGEYHSLALCSDGTLAAWGSNDFGQLGNNSLVGSRIPVAVHMGGALAGRRVVAIDVGSYTCAALCSDGGLVTWGMNASGQLGVEGISLSQVPVNVVFPGADRPPFIVDFSIGGSHTAALCSDGTLLSWGENQYGQLGNGTTTDRFAIVGPDRTGVLAGKRIIEVNTGNYNTYVLCSDGTRAAWGFNQDGQLGDGTTISKSLPSSVNLTSGLSGKTITRLFSRGYHCLAMTADGALAGWGANYSNQISGAGYPVTMPTLFPLTGTLVGRTVVSLYPGSGSSLFVCADGTMSATGYNGSGQLGDNSRTDRTSPVLVSASQLISGERYVTARPGSFHNLALVATPPPLVVSASATSIRADSVTLTGSVDPKGNAATAIFEYGLDPAYGSSVQVAPSLITGSGSFAIQSLLTALQPGTTYHCRLVLTNRAGVARSGNFTFTTNRPPTFTGYSMACPFGQATTVIMKKFLAKAFDPDGDTVIASSVSPSSTGGGSVTLQTGGILYSPKAGFRGADSFTVTLSDGMGNTTNATVMVEVGQPPDAGGMNTNPPKITLSPEGAVELGFHGIPGRIYQIQRSSDMSNWQSIGTATAGSNGSITFIDENPPQPNGFYRLAVP